MTELENFDQYLDKIGAHRVELKREWEISRFKANGQTCVIYQNAKKKISFSSPLAEKVYESFKLGNMINIQTEKRKSLRQKFMKKLLERDGNFCFYTGRIMPEENMTIEHLIPLCRGGKNNIENLVLCLKIENQKMGDKPLIEKIEYKIKNLQSENLNEI